MELVHLMDDFEYYLFDVMTGGLNKIHYIMWGIIFIPD